MVRGLDNPRNVIQPQCNVFLLLFMTSELYTRGSSNMGQ